jgi:alpha-L-rhamnosidase
MLGSVDAWFYRFLGGIQIDPSGPGWQRFIIKPHILGDLTFASASVNTLRGVVSSNWTKHYDSLILEVSIPVNSSAKVSVPKRGWQQVGIKEGDTIIWNNGPLPLATPGITGGLETEEYVTFNAGSGEYRFEVREG